MKHWYAKLPALLLVTWVFGVAAGEHPNDRISNLIESYRLESAKKMLSRNREKTPSARHLFLEGNLAFYEGAYHDALVKVARAIELDKTNLDWKIRRDQIQAAIEIEQTLILARGPHPNILFFVPPGQNQLLVPYADRALNAQRKALHTLLGDEVKRIRVYILSEPRTLAVMAGLSNEQIRTSGTVAVTKYNRIMILSPSAVEGGYPWLDTLAHEYTHLIITRLSANQTPIWLQEGLAKHLEQVWRAKPNAVLTPESAYLLDRAAREGRLIPLRKYHPSVSMLPSQEDAMLAYAQSASFVAYLAHRLESQNQSLKTLLQQLSRSHDVDRALIALIGVPLKKIYRWWKDKVAGTPQTPVAAVPLMERQFRSGLTGKGHPAGLTLLNGPAREHLRIGDLLFDRKHFLGALKEYRKSQKANETDTPAISLRLAKTLIELGRGDKAAAAIEPLLIAYPQHSQGLILLAKAKLLQQQNTDAAATLETAIGVTPLSSELHCLLAQIPSPDHPKRQQNARKNCDYLTNGIGHISVPGTEL